MLRTNVLGKILLSAAGALAFATPWTAPAAADGQIPVAIEICDGVVQGPTNPNLKVGIAFRNNATVDALEVTFDILLMDDTDKIIDTQTGVVDGKFSPGTLIEPRRSPITSALLTQPEYPDSPAWNVRNHFGSGVTRVRCKVHAVKFSDETVWKSGT